VLITLVQALARHRLAGSHHHPLHRQPLTHDQLVQQRSADRVDMKEAREVRQMVLVSRQMDHGIHAVQGRAQRRPVTHIAQQAFRAPVQPLRPATGQMHRWREQIKHPHAVAARQQQIDGMRANEAGATGDEDVQGRSLSP